MHPPKNKQKSQKLFILIISLERPLKEKPELSEYIDYTYHNSLGDNNSGNYITKFPRFDCGTPEEWIIFVDLEQKALLGQM